MKETLRIYDSERDVMLAYNPKSGEYIQTTATGRPTPQAVEMVEAYHPPMPQRSNDVAVSGFGALAQVMDAQFYKGSAADRAKAFNTRTRFLSIAGAIVGLIFALAVQQAPLLSLATFTLIMLGFTAAWLVAFVIDRLLSPEFATLMLTMGMLAWLRAERRERWQRYEQ